MRSSGVLLLLAALGCWLAFGCYSWPQPGGGDLDDDDSGEDDDDVVDDDDTADDDDSVDDDDSADDDDAVDDDDSVIPVDYWGFGFGFELTVDEKDEVAGQLVVQLLDAGHNLLCGQRFDFVGAYTYGTTAVPDCAACNGLIVIDDGSVTPTWSGDGSECEPGSIDLEALSGPLLTPVEGGGDGLLLELALIDVALAVDLDLTFDAAGSYSIEEWVEYLPSDNAATGVAYVSCQADSSTCGDLSSNCATAPDTAGWYAYFLVYRDVTVNTHEGPDLDGQYGASGFWVLNAPE